MGGKNHNKVVAIIPARGGSKRLPGKNVMPLGGKPLILHSIEQAKASRYVSRVIVSTDDQEIRQVALSAGAEIIDRPEHLATDHATTHEVLMHALGKLENPDYVVLLQPTSPLRTSTDIDACVEKMSDCDAVVSVTKSLESPQWMYLEEDGVLKKVLESTPERTQDMPTSYLLNGSVYVFTPEQIKSQNLLGGKMKPYVMPQERSIDIDTAQDLEEAEQCLKQEL